MSQGDQTPVHRMAEEESLPTEFADLEASVSLEEMTFLHAEVERLHQQNSQLSDRLHQESQARQRLEVELQASEARYTALTQVLLETSVDGIVIIDANGNVLKANTSFAEMLGYTPAETARLNLVDWDAHWSEEELRQKAANKELCENRFETRHRRKDGSLYEVEIASNAVDWNGQVIHFCICRDITERKQLQQTLEASEQKLNDVLNNAIASIYSLRVYANREWEYEYQSAGCEALYGYTAQELMADKTLWLARIPQEDLEAVVMPVFDDIVLGKTQTLEFRFRHKDGSIRWISGTYASRYDGAKGCWIVTGVSIDISDRKRIEAALEHEVLRRQTLFDASFDGIVVLDSRGNVVEANHSFARMLGYPLDQVIGLNVVDWEAQWTQTDIDACQPSNGSNQVFETRHRRQDQSLYDVEICCNGIEWEGAIFRFCVCRDISDRKQAEVALKQARDAAESANQAKSVFLATMNHELRTPLTAILGFTQLMERSPLLHPAMQDHLRTIHRSSNHLLSLINDILDLAKIEAGRTELHQERFDVRDLLVSLQELFRQRAQEKGLEFCLVQPPDLPRYLTADARKLRQVLINLLGNAVKFTPAGRVALQVGWDAAEDDASVGALWFDVTDTGVGIAPLDQDRVFDAFTQIASGLETSRGSGLGLTISRNLVQLMGGTLHLSSRPGQGSTFRVQIPAERVDAPPLPPSLMECPIVGLLPGQPSYRVLVVDDHADNRQLLTAIMAQVSLEVREATTGEEAIAQWLQWQPHLIWLDVRMPSMGGYTVAQQIRAQPGGEAVVIIALTAQTDPGDEQMAIAAGCNDLVRKPFQPNLLLTKMEHHLGLRYQYAGTAAAVTLEGTAEAIDLATLHSQLPAMPPEWQAAVYQAAMECNGDDMELLIRAIPQTQTPLATGLKYLMHHYAFDKIMQLTQPE